MHAAGSKIRAALIAVCAVAAVLGAKQVESATPDICQARLVIRVTPDVPNPRDPSFLSALTSSPLYELIWIKGHDQTGTVVLRGPATDYHCSEEIKRMRNASQIEELKVLSQS
jgi:hypothetical protein